MFELRVSWRVVLVSMGDAFYRASCIITDYQDKEVNDHR